MRYLFSFLCLFLLSPFTFAQGKVYGGIYAAKIAVRGEAGPTGVNTPFGKADFILDTKGLRQGQPMGGLDWLRAR